jgi:hypothetical protein
MTNLSSLAMKIERESLISFTKTLIVTICVLTIFTVLSIFPNFSYYGDAQTIVEGVEAHGFLWVRAYPNITFNPFLYTFSWLSGNGYYSQSFVFLSKPPFHVYGPRVLENEAFDIAVLKQLRINIAFNFILLLILGLMEVYDVYLCMLIGAIGFPIAGLLGALASFIITLIIVSYIKIRRGEGVLKGSWNSLERREENMTSE